MKRHHFLSLYVGYLGATNTCENSKEKHMTHLLRLFHLHLLH